MECVGFYGQRIVAAEGVYPADAQGGWAFCSGGSDILFAVADLHEAGINTINGDKLLWWYHVRCRKS